MGGVKMGGLAGAGYAGALVSGSGSAGGRAGAITAADGGEQARPLPVRYGDAVRRRVVGPHRHCCCLGRLARRQLRRPLVLRRRRRRQGDAAATVINSTTSCPPPLHLLVVLHERVDAAAAAAANAAAADAGCSMDEQHTLNEGNIFPERTSIFTSVLICPRWVVRVAQAYPYMRKKAAVGVGSRDADGRRAARGLPSGLRANNAR